MCVCVCVCGGGGAYCFWCGFFRRPRSFLSALCLLDQWMDFDQTCIDLPIVDQKSLSAPCFLNQMTDSGQTSCIVTLG